MDETINFGFPYPECEPPLVKDASDIIQLKNLADAVDAEVQEIFDLASQQLIHPDSCRMAMTAPVAVALGTRQTQIFYDTFNFDNTPAQQMSDETAGAIRILEAGWYMIGHHVLAQRSPGPGTMPTSLRFIKNGLATSNWSVQSSVNVGMAHQFLMMRLEVNDLITSEVHQTLTTTAWTYDARIWAHQLMAV